MKRVLLLSFMLGGASACNRNCAYLSDLVGDDRVVWEGAMNGWEVDLTSTVWDSERQEVSLYVVVPDDTEGTDPTCLEADNEGMVFCNYIFGRPDEMCFEEEKGNYTWSQTFAKVPTVFNPKGLTTPVSITFSSDLLETTVAVGGVSGTLTRLLDEDSSGE